MNQRQGWLRGGALLVTAVLLGGVCSPLATLASAASTTPPSVTDSNTSASSGGSGVSTDNPDGAFNVVVSPPSVGVTVKQGETVSSELRVQNQGLATEHVKVKILKFTARGQDGTPQLEDLQPSDDFVNWATFSSPRFDAEPNVWKTITMTITTPPSAAFGYYYAVVFSREGAEKHIVKKQANLLGAVASLVLLDVQAPGSKREAKITEFSTPHKVQEFLPLDFTVRIHNTGNTHVASRGNIVISKGGKNIALLEVNLKKGFVLPNSYRKFNSQWTEGTPVYTLKTADNKVVLDKHGKQVRELNWDKFSISKLRFGKYDAKLVMVYDDGKGDVSVESKLSFWVVPWRVIAVIAVVGLLVLAGLWATLLRPIVERAKKNRSHGSRR